MFPTRHALLPAVLLAAALWLVRSGPAQPAAGRPGPNFASFESPAEVNRWRAWGGASVEASQEFPSWQTHSLRLAVPAGSTGGAETDYIPANWRHFEALQFFAYAEQPCALSVELAGQGATAARKLELRRGAQHVQIRLKEFSGLDLGGLERLRLAVAGPAVLYLDRFRLTDYNEVLARLGRMDAPYAGEIETPHVRWANPYAKGPIQVLIVPDVAHGRAAVELAQRLECRLFPVTLGASSGTNRWGFGDFYGERGDSYGAPFTLAYTYLADALLNGPHYDVMVLPGLRPWDEFPRTVREAIRKRVEAGMGLLLLDVQASAAGDLAGLSPLEPGERAGRGARWRAVREHYITHNVPLEDLPFDQMRHRRAKARGDVLLATEAGEPILAVRQVGSGRVVAASWEQRGLIPLIENQWSAQATWPYWEYLYSLLARATVWAARKEPAALLRLELDDPARPGRVRVAASPPARVTVTVRDEYGEVEQETTPALPGAAEVELPEPARGRRHFIDVIAREPESGRVIDWGTRTYLADLPAEVADIRFSSDRFRRGEAIAGEFVLRAPTGPGFVLEMSLFDSYGRLLATRQAPLAQATAAVPFSFPGDGVRTRLAWVEGRILENGRERHRKRREVFVLQPRKWDDFDVVMYLFGPDPAPGLWKTIEKRLEEMQVTTLSSYPLELSKHANFGVQAQTRISGQESPDGEARKPYLEQKRNWTKTRDKRYLARLYCLNDPAYRKQQEREIDKLVGPWVPFSPMSYYIYEEPSLTCYTDAMDLCFSPHCMARMREWLRKEYGSLEALNAQWGTQFGRWEEVVPDTTEEAQQRGNYSSWADHRTFMEETYAGNYAYVRDLLHRHDAEGLVLLSGTQESSPHNGCDYSRLNHIVGHLNPYTGGNQLEFLRSFNPGLRMSVGTGYGVSGRRTLYDLYNGLFHGFTAGAYIFWQYSILNPDYRFSESAESIRRALEEIRDGGIARLLRTAHRLNDGIAIHYSYPSIHGSWIVDGHTTGPDEPIGEGAGPTYRKFEANRDGWVNLLKDLGFGFDFVARQEIEAGQLTRRGFRALILPFSVAITAREAAAIRAFVDGGGVVIADAQAGVMDGHARWLASGSLDDLFGIERVRPARVPELASGRPEANLKARGAKSLAELEGVPVAFAAERGKGKAVYLNFFLSSYVEDRRDGREEKWRELTGKALGWAGLEPSFRVLTEAGRPLRGYLPAAYRKNSARYVGLLKTDELEVRPQPITIELGRTWHIYDVRGRRYLGQAGRIRDSIRTAEPKLYALLPEPVRRVRLEGPRTARRGDTVRFRMHVDGGGDHQTVLRFRVLRPDGTLARPYSENLETSSGAAEAAFQIALNDPPGVWRVRATDAVSAREAVLRLEVR